MAEEMDARERVRVLKPAQFHLCNVDFVGFLFFESSSIFISFTNDLTFPNKVS